MKKIFYGICVNFLLTFISYFYVSFLLNYQFNLNVFIIIFIVRQLVSFLSFNDYNLSWSKASILSGFIKYFSNTVSLLIYFSIFRFWDIDVPLNLLLFEYSTFLILITVIIFTYKHVINYSIIYNKENVIIYGAGKAGINIQNELNNSKILFFIDDNEKLHYRSVDGIKIVSSDFILNKKDLELKDINLIIALPSTSNFNKVNIYNKFKNRVKEIKVLPPVDKILQNKPISKQLKKISILELLARNPKDLDLKKISNFIKNKIVLITGSSGTIGNELLNIACKNKAKLIICIDHNEFGQYKILERSLKNVKVYVSSVLNYDFVNKIFKKYKPDIVLHAAAYKHVHLSEYSINSTLKNNIIGTKNIVDISIKNKTKKFVLISTDKAVNPTNIMGASKSICELYCQNVESLSTEIISVRFGNVLGSSGSVIPKFQKQIDNDEDLTVTHKNITRYFMLVSEACSLVYQAASIGKNGEILILNMGQPVKISQLAQKMINLSGKDYLKVKYIGLRKGEKLFEELLFSEDDKKTEYDSITIAKKRKINFQKLVNQIKILTEEDSNHIKIIKEILPHFNHMRDN